MKEGSDGASAALNMSPAAFLLGSALLQKTVFLLQTGSLPSPPFSDVFEQPNFTGEESMGIEVLHGLTPASN